MDTPKNAAAQALRALAKPQNMKRGDAEYYRQLVLKRHAKRKEPPKK